MHKHLYCATLSTTTTTVHFTAKGSSAGPLLGLWHQGVSQGGPCHRTLQKTEPKMALALRLVPSACDEHLNDDFDHLTSRSTPLGRFDLILPVFVALLDGDS